ADALLLGDLVDELGATPLEHLGDTVQHLPAVVGRGTRPALHRRAGGDDGVPGILARRLGGVGEEVALGGEHLVGAAGLAARERPADRELVRLRNAESAGISGSPAHADAPFRYAV